MKYINFLISFIGLTFYAAAQPVQLNHNRKVKLSDVIEQHKKATNVARTFDDKVKNNNWDLAKILKGEQDKDYQFERWLWYWKNHTDLQGYLVSPAKNFAEWKKMQEQNKFQSGERTTSTSLNWVFQGPDSSGAFTGDGAGSGVGRINTIGFHPTDSNTFWIGSPGGGAWKTTNNGVSWSCMTDQLPNLSISDIKFNPLNPNTIFLCSGDRDGSDYYGIGVLKSYNGGITWNVTGMSWPDSLLNIANAILVNPLDTNSLILGTTIGLYRSFNGGTSWILAAFGNFDQLLYRPNDTNIVYACMVGNGSTNAQIFRSSNGGMGWTQVTTFTSVDRVSIAVTPAAPNNVKAITSSSSFSTAEGLGGIYSSTDTGHNFTEIYTGNCSGNDLLGWSANASDCNGQGWYDLTIAISPLNANIVYIGGVNAWKSTNGGSSWSILNYWTTGAAGVAIVHADKHFMGFNPLCPVRFFEANDGGIYSAYNASSSGTWVDLTNGIGNTEFYRVATSGLVNFALAGAQDNGSKIIRNGLYKEADGGDGMQAQLDFVDSTVGYTSMPGGFIDIINPTAVQPDLTAIDISANIVSGTIEGTGAWVTPFVIEPSAHTCLLAGYQQLFRSCDKGSSWNAISSTLSGSANNLYRIATSLSDSNTIYATEDASTNMVYYTNDLGATWLNTSVPFAMKYISDIHVDPRNKNHLFASFSGYGSPHFAEFNAATGAWITNEAGLPDVPINCIAINKNTREIFLGTEIGIYYKDSTMTSWVPNTTGMPSVSVTDVEINYTAGEIWASTFGRSLWRAMIPTTVSIVPFADETLRVMPNPNGGQFTVQLNNTTARNIDMTVRDVTGRVVWVQNSIRNNGSNYSIKLNSVAPGTYLLEVSSEGNIFGRQKIVVNR